MRGNEYLFSPIVSDGLGVCFSSLETYGAIVPSQGVGAAKLRYFINIATGNLVVQDPLVEAHQCNETVEFGFTYNSHTTTPWTMKLQSLSDPTPGSTPTVMLNEGDGHQTLYTYDAASGNYYPPTGSMYGLVTLTKLSDGSWKRFIPSTQRTESYNSDGQLLSVTDAKGRETSYTYDVASNCPLIITGPNGNTCKILHSKISTGSVYNCYVTQNGTPLLERVYEFDTKGRLTRTSLGFSYGINYEYFSDSNLIKTITQSDGTVSNFTFSASETAAPQCETVSAGDENSVSARVDYSTPDAPLILGAQGQSTSVELEAVDGVTKVQSVTKLAEVGSSSNVYDTTSLTYDAALHRIETKTNPQSGVDHYTYDVTNLVASHEGACGQKTEWLRDNGLLLVKTQYLPVYDSSTERAIATRYVYDTDLNDKEGATALRFKISPMGAVTEYRYDTSGDCTSKRIYLAGYYPTAGLTDNQVPTLAEMETWAASMPADQVRLESYTYNSRGFVSKKLCYATVDSDGNGVLTDASQESGSWTYYGKRLTHTLMVDETDNKKTTQKFDSAKRLTYKSISASDNPVLTQTTQTTYDDAHSRSTTVFPDDRTVVSRNSSSGFEASLDQSVQQNGSTVSRDTTYERDDSGRVIITELPDGQKAYTLFDYQNRLQFTIDALGNVVEHVYDAQVGSRTTTAYATPIDVSNIQPSPSVLPTSSTIQNLLVPDSSEDRTSYQFYDQSGRLQYAVDGLGYVAEHYYDIADREVGVVKYATALTAAQLSDLQTGKAINLTPTVSKDRWTQYFYDDDGHKIAEQDPAGYVTEWVRDPAGNVLEKIQYAVPTEHVENIFDVIPIPAEEDAHHYYFWDGRGQCIADIDAMNYVTTHVYSNSGKLQQTLAYANPAQADPVTTRDLNDLLPNPSSEDRTTTYEYDGLDRLQQTNAPFNLQTNLTYNVMNKPLTRSAQDLQTGYEQTRSTYHQYDEWEQVTAIAPPMVAELIEQASTQAEKDAIWANQSSRHAYDDSGLRLCTTSPEGRKTLYYYNAARQPLFVVNGRGAVRGFTLNAFGEKTETRAYTTLLDATTLASLQGGFITPELEAAFEALSVPSTDVVHQATFDQCGNAVTKTDPNGFTTVNTFTAFKQVDTSTVPVADQSDVMIVNNTYEVRGHKTRTVKTADSHAIENIYEYANQFGKCTIQIDPMGNMTAYGYDARGIQNRVVDPLGGATLTEHDAFRRSKLATNPEALQTTYVYDQAKRSHTISKSGKPGDTVAVATTTILTETQNAFGESVAVTDGLGNARTMEYGLNGKLTANIDELGNANRHAYDLDDLERVHTTPDQVETFKTYDEARNQQAQEVDPDELAITSAWEHDAFDRSTTFTDPNGVNHTTAYFQGGQVKQTITDPSTETHSGLEITNAYERNAMGATIQKILSSALEPNYLTKGKSYDGFGRRDAESVDPENLNLTTQQKLDANGDVVEIVDPNGQTTYQFYDENRSLRFVISAAGCITEHYYNAVPQKIGTRQYAVKLNPDLIGTFSSATEVKAAINPLAAAEDQALYIYYDAAGNQQYEVNADGAVIETVYDAAFNKVQTIGYSTAIDITSNPLTLTTEQVASLIHPNESDDRVTYRIFDAARRERFTIDAAGYICEQRYDACNRVTACITYSAQLSDPSIIANLPSDEVLGHITLKPTEDRAYYYAYDSRGKPQYAVSPTGTVTLFDHDDNGNEIVDITFAKPLADIPTDYDALTALLRADYCEAESGVDRITQHEYDADNRKISTLNALEFSDQYTYHPDRQQATHTDKAGNVWKKLYDTAARVTDEVSPSITITLSIENTDAPGTYTPETYEMNTVTHYELDPAGNKLEITLGYGAPDARTVSFNYDGDRRMIGSGQTDVEVDNPLAPASFSSPPTVTLAATTAHVFDGKGNAIVHINEKAIPSFKAYDSNNKARYIINVLGYVLGLERNAFGEIISITRYNNALKEFDYNDHIKTGISMDMVEILLQPDSTVDEVKMFVRDQRGKVLATQLGERLCYIPNYSPETGSTPIVTDFAPVQSHTYNAFGENIADMAVISQMENTFSVAFTWYSQTGKKLAEADPDGGITVYQYGAFDNLTVKTEYATQITLNSTQRISFEALQAQIQPSPDDRTYVYFYDILGQKTGEGIKNAVVQEVTFTIDNVPEMADMPAQDLMKAYVRDAMGNVVEKIDEAGNAFFFYYNARNELIAETNIERVVMFNDVLDSVAPLTYYGVTSHGEKSATTTFALGTKNPQLGEVPTPIEADLTQDQQELKAYDKRGLIVAEQDACGNARGRTHTLTKKMARKWWYLTNVEQTGTAPDYTYTPVRHIDSQYFVYSELDYMIVQGKCRDGVDQPNFIWALNPDGFGRTIAEGPGWGDWKIQYKYDINGQKWFSNKKNGSAELMLRDGRGAVTAIIQSATDDLMQYDYVEIPAVLEWDNNLARVERTQRFWDLSGKHMTAVLAPGWESPTPPTLINQENNPSILSTANEVQSRGDVDAESASLVIMPYRTYTLDRWKNKKAVTDANGNMTEQTFSYCNKLLTQTLPEADVMQPDNTVVNETTTLKRGYNALGFQVASINGNDHVTAYVLDAAGITYQTVLGDGTIERTSFYDIFKNEVTWTDARAQDVWIQTFSQKNSVLSMTSPGFLGVNNEPLQQVMLYDYSERNKRTFSQIGPGSVYHYNYDPDNNVSEQFLPMGNSTTMSYARNHVMVVQENIDGTNTWNPDTWGNIQSVVDLSGSLTTNTLDYKKQCIETYCDPSISGAHGKMVATYPPDLNFNDIYYVDEATDTPGQHQEYTYVAGKVGRIKDKSLDLMSIYNFDAEGDRVGLSIQFDTTGTMVAESISTYDSRRRRDYLSMNGSIFTWQFDCADNRRHVNAQLFYNGKNEATHDSWSTFDAAERVLIEDGVLNTTTNSIEINSSQGYSYGYADNFRVSQQAYGHGDLLDSEITYYPNGLFECVRTTTDGTYVKKWYDSALRNILIETDTWDGLLEGKNYAKTSIGYNYDSYMIEFYYDENSGQSTQKTEFSNFSYYGIARNQTTYYSPGYVTKDVLNTYLVPFTALKIGERSGHRYDGGGIGPFAAANMYYDPNGAFNSVVGNDGKVASNYPSANKDFYYTVNDCRGQAHSKYNVEIDFHEESTGRFYADATQTQEVYIYDVNDSYVANYTIEYNVETLDQPDIWLNKAWDGKQVKSVSGFTLQLNYAPPVGTSYTPGAPSLYVVVSGDSFASISMKEFGSELYGPQIAQANGYSASITPPPGTVIEIPQILPMVDTYGACEPYTKLLSSIMGNLYPALQAKQPPPPSSSFFDEFIEAIVCIVVAIAVPEIAGALLPAMVSSTSLLVSTTLDVAEGLVENAIDQEVAVGIGLQSRFSWSELAESGITAALSPSGKFSFGSASDIGKDVELLGEDMAAAAGTQLTEMAVGLRSKFDFGAMAEQVGSFVAGQGRSSVSTNSIPKDLIADGVEAMTDTGIDAVFGSGPITADTFITNLSNAIGSDGQFAGEIKSDFHLMSRSTMLARRQEAAFNEEADALNAPNPTMSADGWYNFYVQSQGMSYANAWLASQGMSTATASSGTQGSKNVNNPTGAGAPLSQPGNANITPPAPSTTATPTQQSWSQAADNALASRPQISSSVPSNTPTSGAQTMMNSATADGGSNSSIWDQSVAHNLFPDGWEHSLAVWTVDHQSHWYGRAVADVIMSTGSYFASSSGQALVGAFNASAQEADSMNPFVAMGEAATHRDPVTGAYVGEGQAWSQFALNTVTLFTGSAVDMLDTMGASPWVSRTITFAPATVSSVNQGYQTYQRGGNWEQVTESSTLTFASYAAIDGETENMSSLAKVPIRIISERAIDAVNKSLFPPQSLGSNPYTSNSSATLFAIQPDVENPMTTPLTHQPNYMNNGA